MTNISASSGIVPLEEAQAGLAHLLDEIARTGEAIVITKEGRAAAVLLSPEEFDALQCNPEYLAAVDEALATIDREPLIEGDTVAAWLRSIGTDAELPPPA